MTQNTILFGQSYRHTGNGFKADGKPFSQEYNNAEMLELFTSAQRVALQRGEKIIQRHRHSETTWISANALCTAALAKGV